MAAQVSEALAATERAGFTAFLEGAPPLPLEEIANATLVGLQVGPYLVDAELGHGGMGSVWRAHRTDGLFQGMVAIKFVHTAWIGGSGAQRFRVEGNLLGRLDHPNIARLIDAGVLTGAQPYLILEYVEGEPIDSYCEREKLDLEARIRLFLDVLAAVAHAHSLLIVHRDIKPGNIFVSRGGAVKLLDFGIAKLLQEETGAAASTKSAGAALTPRYAAPEQVLGKPVTTATDVYSLGLVLYLLLTGRHPISSAGLSGADLMRAVLQEIPAKASAMSVIPSIRRRSLEGDLDNILGKALKKDSKERYASVGEFADDLRRFLADEPVQARPDSVRYRVSKFVRRHRAGVLIALLVACGLIGTSAVALWQLHQANVERDIARNEVRRGRALDLLNAFMLNESSAHEAPDDARRRLDHAVDFIEHSFADDKGVMASLLFGLAPGYTDIGEAELASKTTAKADALVEQLDDLNLKAEAGCRRAHDFAIAQNIPEARLRLAEAQRDTLRLRRVASGLRTQCGIAAALIAQADGDYAKAIVDLRAVLTGLDDENLHGSRGWTAVKNEMARAQFMAGDFRGAVDTDTDNLREIKAGSLRETGRYFATASLVCNALRQGGQPMKSRAFVDSILVDVRAVVPTAQLPFYLVGCRALAELAMELKSPPVSILSEAAGAARSAGNLAIANTYRTALIGEAATRSDAAAAQAQWGELASDEQKMLDAKEHGLDAVRLVLAHANLDMLQGRTDQAEQRIDQAAEMVAARHQPTNADARDVAMSRVRLAFRLKQFAHAATDSQAALEIARSYAIEPKSSYWIGEALLWRARAEAAMGDTAKARATAREALPHLEENVDAASGLLAAARSF